jgi:ABC-type Fe3+-siderophore transport system permease subunit
MPAAVDSAGAALGATGMLAFAIVFSLTAETSIAAAFMVASFTWLIVSVAAWYVRRKARSVRRVRTAQEGSGSSIRRGR